MSKEAMKLAAEFNRYFTSMNGVDVPERVSVPRDEWRALFEALAEQPAQQEPWEHLKAYGYAPGGYMMTCRGCNSTVTGVDKRASRCMPCATKAAEQPAQQEPVAYIHRQGNHYEVSERFLSDDEKARGWTEEPLYTSPPAQRKPLTDEEIWKFWWSRPEVPEGEDDSMEAEFVAAVRAVLAAHGIKENT